MIRIGHKKNTKNHTKVKVSQIQSITFIYKCNIKSVTENLKSSIFPVTQ